MTCSPPKSSAVAEVRGEQARPAKQWRTDDHCVDAVQRAGRDKLFAIVSKRYHHLPTLSLYERTRVQWVSLSHADQSPILGAAGGGAIRAGRSRARQRVGQT